MYEDQKTIGGPATFEDLFDTLTQVRTAIETTPDKADLVGNQFNAIIDYAISALRFITGDEYDECEIPVDHMQEIVPFVVRQNVFLMVGSVYKQLNSTSETPCD